MDIGAEQIRSYRLRAHHLAQKQPMDALAAAGVCGLQNTPPGAWQTALHNRLQGCTLQALHGALYNSKELLQAWSFRGVPAIFPTAQSDVFLTPLVAQEGEQPWIYTQGITAALEHVQMPFDEALARTKEAVLYLDTHTIKRKEVLDQTLADIVCQNLPKEKQALWNDPSMYGSPDKQTVGGAAVSFLLRPCSFYSLVVFGRRQNGSPSFTSYKNWLGHAPARVEDAEKALVRKFLHAYGPATPDYFTAWLGCSRKQAKRLWAGVADEMTPVKVAGKTHHMLLADMDALLHAPPAEDRLLLLGAHDPYLDLRDRTVILQDKTCQKTVWQYVANPGAVLKGGRVTGIWKTKTLPGKLEILLTLWEAPAPGEEQKLKDLAEEYAAFRRLALKSCTIETA